MRKHFRPLALCGAAFLVACGDTGTGVDSAGGDAKTILNVYNWSDYIAEDTIANFEKETGIKVNYDVFDSNDVLEGKLLAGNTGFDIVAPSLSFMGRQIQAGVFQPLEKDRLSNLGKLDPELMQKAANMDPGNAYGIPYMWGTTGIGYNVAKVQAIMGEGYEIDSWAAIFEEDNLSKLSACGVAFMDERDEMLPAMMHYLGMDPNSTNPDDYTGKPLERFMQLREHVRYFHNSQYVNDLANGDICVAVGWSGDVAQAAGRAEEAGNGVELAYVIPKEGAQIWVDMFAIPQDAKNIEAAHKFLDYIMRPDVMAAVTNYVWYPNAIPESLDSVDPEISGDTSIYPDVETTARLWAPRVLPVEIDRVMTRTWTRVRTGQ
jgi:putrescine transport system substrate-binding protein